MEILVQLGPARLTLLQVVPGRPGEAVRVHDALRKLDPDLICAELTLKEALRVEDALLKGKEPEPQRFLEQRLREGLTRFGRVEHRDPFAAAARYARENRLLYLPLSQGHHEPGPFTRLRFTHHLRKTDLLAEDEEGYARALDALAREDPKMGPRLLEEERLLAAKIEDVMEREQRTRVAAILTYPRGERVAGHLREAGFGPARKDGLVPWETR
ncbi:MAG TPA: hypothetical protein VNZ52_15295 [Candidatus Thermoplasmatota archaeon]|nr:hypothetical protein [Candidatus Thermoplasmatota archaeon]